MSYADKKNTVSLYTNRTKSYDGCGAAESLIRFMSSVRVLLRGKLFTEGSKRTVRKGSTWKIRGRRKIITMFLTKANRIL